VLKLRIVTVNVGSLSRRSGEVAEMVSRRHLDFCCLQESRWKGEVLGQLVVNEHGINYSGWEVISGVGGRKFDRQGDRGEKMSDRVTVLRVTVGKSVLNLVSVYAP